jgi:uncharacterized protein
VTLLLERTFQLIKGVGAYRERELWAQNIFTWNDFLKESDLRIVMSKRLDLELKEAISSAKTVLASTDSNASKISALCQHVAPKEGYRLYGSFINEAAFFDIEADGDDVPTVVGIMDKEGVASFRRGHSLEQVCERLSKSPIWVTFNGSVYDVPALKKHFGEDRFPTPLVHIDLRFLMKHAKLKGGLKSIEEKLGLHRPPHLKGINGLAAINLWRIWNHTRDIKALRILMEYNMYDVINLRSILEWTLWQIERQFDDQKPQLFDRGDVLYDVSKLILSV